MKSNWKKIALIIVLMIAVAAAAYGVVIIQRAERTQAGTDSAEITADTANGSGSAGDEDADSGSDGTEEAGPLATVFFASDYQEESGFDEPAETLRGVLGAAKADGKAIDAVVMCGDYTNDAVLHDYQLSPDESIEEIRAIVAEECSDAAGDGSGVNMVFVQGNHDKMTGEITPTGIYDCGEYLIYVLNTEEDFPWKQGKTAGCLAKVKKSAAAMKECFDGLTEKGETRPVFIAGHVPLHYTARTSSRHTTGDNLYSSLIYNVVNDAAKDLDIVYLYGHNHSKGWDCYMGGGCVYKEKGETLLLPKFEESQVNTDEYTEETLDFTYMNAGYTGYYMNCGPAELEAGTAPEYSAADETLTGTVIEVYADRLEITRYDSEGAHALGSAGEADPYKGGIDEGLIPESAYSHETPSPQIIESVNMRKGS